MKNYRPVSNIPLISKLLEKVEVSRLVEHISRKKLMEEHESAYRTEHRKETALLNVHHDIANTLDNKCAVAFVMLDLSAVFHTIDQDQLLTLLNVECGVNGKALSWIRTYLEVRTQRVKIDDVT